MSRVLRLTHLLLVVASLMLISGEVAFGQESDSPVADLDGDLDRTDSSAEPADAVSEDTSMLDEVAGKAVGWMATVIFFDVSFGATDELGFTNVGPVPKKGLPLAVVWLVLGAIFFTFRMGFINVRAFKHALRVTAGKYDRPEDAGEVTHFQALTAALSATSR